MKPELGSTLQWLAGGGAAVVAALVVSWLAENWDWFKALTATQKRLMLVVLCVAFGLGAWATITYVPPATLLALETPFRVIFISLTALLSTQVWHALVNQNIKKTGQ